MDLSNLSSTSRELVRALVEENNLLREEFNSRLSRLSIDNEELRISLANLENSFQKFQKMYLRLTDVNYSLRKQIHIEQMQKLGEDGDITIELNDMNAHCFNCLLTSSDSIIRRVPLVEFYDVHVCEVCIRDMELDESIMSVEDAISQYELTREDAVSLIGVAGGRSIAGTKATDASPDESITNNQNSRKINSNKREREQNSNTDFSIKNISRDAAERLCLRKFGSMSVMAHRKHLCVNSLDRQQQPSNPSKGTASSTDTTASTSSASVDTRKKSESVPSTSSEHTGSSSKRPRGGRRDGN